jgi:hypothetical protein
MNLSETLEKRVLETLIPIKTNGRKIIKSKKWSHSKLPLNNKSREGYNNTYTEIHYLEMDEILEI